MTPARRLLHYLVFMNAPDARRGVRGRIGAVLLAKPLIVGNAVNALGGGFTREILIRYGLLPVGASVVEGIFLLQRRIIIGASRLIEYEIRGDFYEHLQRLPLRFYQEQRTGDLMSRATNDLSSVRMLVGPATMHSLSRCLVVTGAAHHDAAHQRAELLALTAVPIVAGIVKAFGQRSHDRTRAVQDYFGEISARVQENLSGVRVVRAFTREASEVETFKRMNHEYVERNRSLIRLTATFYPRSTR
jgi:ATP-binding cassette subfamily B protein